MKINRLWIAALPFVLSACIGTSKSSTPLSPAIAGPIAGVGISTPAVMAPAVDAQINTTAQPITLKVQNATTNGVRPLTYVFEIATDLGFTNKVLTHSGVAQDPSGATSYQLGSLLAPERKYYWHARAEDGANASDFSGTSAFSVFTPVVFSAPTPVAPIGDVTTSSQQPTFIIGDVDRTGPVGSVVYYIEIASSASFSPLVAAYSFPESADQSQITMPISLAAGQYFWHVRASDPGHTGPFSGVQSFHTPAGGTGGGGTGGGGGGTFNPNGNWQACSAVVGGGSDQSAVSQCVHDVLQPVDPAGDLEVGKRVAWLLRAQGGGLLIKNGGDNIAPWQGYSFSTSRVCLPSTGANAELWKIISDAGFASQGSTNGASWQDNGTVASSGSSCVPAMDPSLP